MRRAVALFVALAGSLIPAASRGEDRAARAQAQREPAGALSCGSAVKGALARGVPLAVRGRHHRIPAPWRRRNRRWGTPELVALIERAASRVARRHPGSILGVADLSRRFGGRIRSHLSHQSGRDVDLLYYAVDREGRALPPDRHMPDYQIDGRANSAREPRRAPRIRERYFDPARNWALVKALLEDREVAVTRIYVSRRVERWLIWYAASTGEPPALVARAWNAMRRSPHLARRHNNHMHVQIACSTEDVRAGACRDARPPRHRPLFRRGHLCRRLMERNARSRRTPPKRWSGPAP